MAVLAIPSRTKKDAFSWMKSNVGRKESVRRRDPWFRASRKCTLRPASTERNRFRSRCTASPGGEQEESSLSDGNVYQEKKGSSPESLVDAVVSAMRWKAKTTLIREEMEAQAQEALEELEVRRGELQRAEMLAAEAMQEAEGAVAIEVELVKKISSLQEQINKLSGKKMTKGEKEDGKEEVMQEVQPESAVEEVLQPSNKEEERADEDNATLLIAKEQLVGLEKDLMHAQARSSELEGHAEEVAQLSVEAKSRLQQAENTVSLRMDDVERAISDEMEATKALEDVESAVSAAQAAEERLQSLSTEEGTMIDIQSTLAEEEALEAALEAFVEAEVKEERLAERKLDETEAQALRGLDRDSRDLDTDGDMEATDMESVPKEMSQKIEAPQAKRSSKFLSASYFSSSILPDKWLPNVYQALRRKRAKVLGAFVVLTFAVVGSSHFFKKANIAPLPSIATAAEKTGLTAAYKYMRRIPSEVNHMMEEIPSAEHSLEEEGGLLDVLWLLATSVIVVPLVSQLPGGSPVLGFLLGGALIGPHSLAIINNVEAVRYLAEFGVVFLLFNIGLELSLERLQSMGKFVFGMGSAQVILSTGLSAAAVMALTQLSGPGALIVGGGLAMSSTAVALQVLQDRGESGSRHGRATFSILLFQDLAVVAFLMMVPLLAPSGAPGGIGVILKALGVAAVKAVVCMTAITAGGRLLCRPIYRRIASMKNAEIFAALTLLAVLGTSVITQQAGLSMALGAFLAGLLLAETEFALQVESDIAPYRGLLLGLFFMTVGMEISPALLVARWKVILLGLGALLAGKVAIMGAVGPMFGLPVLVAARAGLFIAPGGEFAFVLLGEAVKHNVVPAPLVNELFLVVGLSMAVTPWIAACGQFLASLNKGDVSNLQPTEGENADLSGHVIIAGFGRVGQMIGQLLSERLIPFVAVDVNADRVASGRQLDLPVYFGDAGSPAVLHSVGAGRAKCAVITLDTPGANYRVVWAMNKNYPSVKTYVRARDVEHGLNLEKAGATAVVPETLEPSLQLAAAVLSQMELPDEEVVTAIDSFRRAHVRELSELAEGGGFSLGYGMPRMKTDTPSVLPDGITSGDQPDPGSSGSIQVGSAPA